MRLQDIPTKRLKEVSTEITPAGTVIRMSIYTADGIDACEATKEQIDTELKVRQWRQS